MKEIIVPPEEIKKRLYVETITNDDGLRITLYNLWFSLPNKEPKINYNYYSMIFVLLRNEIFLKFEKDLVCYQAILSSGLAIGFKKRIGINPYKFITKLISKIIKEKDNIIYSTDMDNVKGAILELEKYLDLLKKELNSSL